MDSRLENSKRILIIGDAGRGKSTLSKKISEKLNLPFYSTDNFFWKKKFTIPNDKEESIEKIRQVYFQDEWVVEGGTTHLIGQGLEKADLILHLRFKNIFLQWLALIKRNRKRKNESTKELLNFLIHSYRKRHDINYRQVRKTRDMLKRVEHKTIYLNSYKEIDNFISDK